LSIEGARTTVTDRNDPCQFRDGRIANNSIFSTIP